MRRAGDRQTATTTDGYGLFDPDPRYILRDVADGRSTYSVPVRILPCQTACNGGNKNADISLGRIVRECRLYKTKFEGGTGCFNDQPIGTLLEQDACTCYQIYAECCEIIAFLGYPSKSVLRYIK